MTASAGLPIGVFDSGMGGLTVLAELRRAMPCESFVYLGDSARLPYGTKSAATVERYARQAAAVLATRGVKALVVACNTASATALPALARDFAPLPVFGVLEPGARAAANAANASGVLVLATESTIQGGAYQRALLAEKSNMPVHGRACHLWVTLAEQGHLSSRHWLDAQILSDGLKGLARLDSAPSEQRPTYPSTILLGCTHFPVFRRMLQDILGARVTLVDSAETTALAVAQALAEQNLLCSEDNDQGFCQFLATDGVARFRKVGQFFLGEPIANVELVDL